MLAKFRARLDKIKARQQLVSSYWDESKNKDVLSFFTRIIPVLVNVERCSIFIHNPKNETVWLQSGSGVEERQIEVPKEGSMVGTAIISGKPIFQENMDSREGTHKQIDSITGFTTRNALCVPVMNLNGDRVTGVIQVLNKNGGEPFTDEDITLLEEVARHLAFSIENIFLGQEVLDFTENLFNTAKRLTLQFIAMTVVTLLLFFAYLLGWIVFSG